MQKYILLVLLNVPPLNVISVSGLVEQQEQIKSSPETLSIEQISQLWTAFGAIYNMASVIISEIFIHGFFPNAFEFKEKVNMKPYF